MQPSLEELCEHYDKTASEVTRRSVDIARMRKSGCFGGGALKQHEHVNSNLHEHLAGVSVSMRFHVYEVFTRLHTIGEELTLAMAGLGESEQATADDDTKVNSTAEHAEESTCKRGAAYCPAGLTALSL